MKQLYECIRQHKKATWLIFGECVIVLALALFSILSSRDKFQILPQDLICETGSMDAEGYWKANDELEGTYTIFTPYMDFHAGSYNIHISYKTEADGICCDIADKSIADERIEYDKPIQLLASEETVDIPIRVRSLAKEVVLKTMLPSDSLLQIKKIDILENNAFRGETIFYVLISLLLLDLLLLCYHKKEQWTKGKTLVLFAILLACMPLLVDYLVKGQDIEFHLLRIEGIKEALQFGQFPVRINPTFLEGYGYPTSIYYPELFLYIPALLRIIGLPVLRAYKLFIAIINISAALIAFSCAVKCFKNETKAGIFALVYTLSAYRLVNLYYRAALGEALAQVFIPMVFAGLFLVLANDISRKDRKTGVIYLVIGISGVFQSHILSCTMIGIFILLVMLIFIKRVLSKRVLWCVLQVSFWVGTLNAWFLIPFLQGMRESIRARMIDNTSLVGRQALCLYQLFAVNQKVSGNSTSLLSGIANEMPLSLGLPIVILGIVAICCGFVSFNVKELKESSLMKISLLLGLIATLMTTYFFPWDLVIDLPLIGRVLGMIQYPWRYLGVASFFLIIAGVCAIDYLTNEKAKSIMVSSVVIISAISSMLFFESLIENTYAWRVYETRGLDSMTVVGGEYLYSDTDYKNMDFDSVLKENIQKDGTTVTFKIQNNNTTDKLYVGLPLLYSPFYRAKVLNTDLKIDLIYGDKAVLCAVIPENFNGVVQVSIEELPLWIAADVISAVAIMGFVFACIYRRKNLSTRNEGLTGEKTT